MKFTKSPSTGSDGDFLKIEPGKSVTGVFRGDIHEFYVLWKEDKYTPVPEGTPGSRFRFRVNFVMNSGDGYKSVIWDQGPMVYNQLKEFNNDYPLESTIIKIARQGTKLDTTYSFLPNPRGHEVNKLTEGILKEVKLQDLSIGLGEQKKEAPKEPPSFEEEESLPF